MVALKILLLDVDGVLIHARGYRAAIRETLGYVLHRMGQTHLTPPQEADMLAFEAESIIFEWDSAPLCAAALLAQAPDLLQDTFEATLDQIAHSGRKLSQPDYQALARSIPKPTDKTIKPSRAALGTIFPEHPVFVELLGNAHTAQAPITRIFQHFVLGSEQFARTYAAAPQFDTESMLEKHDVPMLSPEYRELLLNDPQLFPVIYTARPSLPPTFVMNWLEFSPEAEIGQRLLQLQGIPLIAYGRLQWLAGQCGVWADTYVKPSPVHGLLAVYSAVLQGKGDKNWERHALDLMIAREALPAEYRTDPWEIIVLEDSYSSINGVREAAAQIAQYHEVTFKGVGIANDPAKTASLSRVADFVAPDVNAGLAWALKR